MRLRNVKNKQEIMDRSKVLEKEATTYFGKWNEVFGNDHPIYIEIGMGKGNFIIGNAKMYPEINFIGIERYDSVIARALEKVPERLPNLRMIRMNAFEIESVFDHEIDLIYLNFSDPWPKSRHAKRRLTSEDFLKKYDSIFKRDGVIIQKTDNVSLFEYSLVSLSQYGYLLEEISFNLHHSGFEGNILTEYEAKFQEKGQPIYRVVARKSM